MGMSWWLLWYSHCTTGLTTARAPSHRAVVWWNQIQDLPSLSFVVQHLLKSWQVEQCLPCAKGIWGHQREKLDLGLIGFAFKYFLFYLFRGRITASLPINSLMELYLWAFLSYSLLYWYDVGVVTFIRK